MSYKGGVYGDVVGNQTVNKSELIALAELLERTEGPIQVAVDSSYVVKGFHKGVQGRRRTHLSTWARIWERLRIRKGTVKVVKVKSHHDTISLQRDQPEAWQ
eukprot:3322292-Karenia_brevis.AAC.1